ncbi:hypothetical protein [Hymenobacter negativus]|uniref:Uncharacterized protein n=1 Tax=Hymenobacter negativus TaxID=2795026 RepID=A0ABS3QDA6_9BACT|nr:hypothetical protein [Hymenobacter negativus]MBO2009196.1 hypothetical protein [Hymenobacter negativus]
MPLVTPVSRAWDLLFDFPALRATLDALPGYTFPGAARAALLAQYGMSEADFTSVLDRHRRLRINHGRRGPYGPRPRNGWDLIVELPELRTLLDKERENPVLDALTLTRRRERFRLTMPEMVNLLHAHADAWSRP